MALFIVIKYEVLDRCRVRPDDKIENIPALR
ncbi:hypothetical protein BH11BAC4_BH11BAC4_04920 [soil metagenome]